MAFEVGVPKADAAGVEQPEPAVAAMAWRRSRGAAASKCAGANILMFGDGGWLAGRTDAQWRRLDRWMARASRPVAIELGAGTAIPTVRLFAERSGGALVRINPTEPDIGMAHGVGIASGALAGLRAIQSALERLRHVAHSDGIGDACRD
jgi:hypothetical protein